MITERIPPLPTLRFAAIATIAVIAATGCSLDVSLHDDTTSRSETESIPVGDLRSLDVTTENGSIEVRGGDGDEITVRTVLRETDDGDATYSVDVDDDRLAAQNVEARTDNGSIDIGYRSV